MALNLAAILDPVVSHALASGWFERVNTHEPKSAPTKAGLTCAVWSDDIGPAAGQSGLASTTGLVILFVRLYTSMVQEPADAIDPNLVDALSALFTAYSGDFELGGLVRNVDLLGAAGSPGLRAKAGYINQDSKLYRVFTITLPLVVNDVWDQTP
jgi:hypothetical protein